MKFKKTAKEKVKTLVDFNSPFSSTSIFDHCPEHRTLHSFTYFLSFYCRECCQDFKINDHGHGACLRSHLFRFPLNGIWSGIIIISLDYQLTPFAVPSFPFARILMRLKAKGNRFNLHFLAINSPSTFFFVSS